MEKGLTCVAVSYGHSKFQTQHFITSWLTQTCPDWTLYVVHDGPNEEFRSWVEPYTKEDTRVQYRESPERRQLYGHPNRKWIFETEPMREFFCSSNVDNSHFPPYVEWMLGRAALDEADIVMNGIVHNYGNVNGQNDPPYSVLFGKPHLNRADWMNFIIRTELLKKVGINHVHFTGCDGMIMNEALSWFPETRVAYCPHILGCHN